MVKQVEDILKEHDAWGATFFDIGQHTPIAGIREGIKEYHKYGCDSIVSVGGGSPVDASKAILYNIQNEVGGKTPPQIAIPTTLSAAEYSVCLSVRLGHASFLIIRQIGAGFTNEEGQKVAISSQELAPAGIILDAELTLSTPEWLWYAFHPV